MANELLKLEGHTKQETQGCNQGQKLVTCKLCRQQLEPSQGLAVCINTTCSNFFVPVEPEYVDLTINSIPPEDAIWITREGFRVNLSEMDQSHLAQSLRMMYRNPGWRLRMLPKLVAWARYRGVNFEGEFRALAATARQIASQS